MVSFSDIIKSLERVSSPKALTMDGRVVEMDGEQVRMDDCTGMFDKVIDRLEKV